MIAHPERRLQKGLVSLKDLRKLGLLTVAAFIILLSTFTLNLQILFTFFLLVSWITLMTFEFFSKNWLQDRLFLYSVSHLLVSPFLILFCASLVGTLENRDLIYMVGVSFFSAFSYEVARKVKGLDEENKFEKNYMNSYGKNKSLVLYVSVSLFPILCSTQLTEVSSAYLFLYILAYVYVLLTSYLFYNRPIKKFRKLNEASSVTLSLISFVIPIIHMFQK